MGQEKIEKRGDVVLVVKVGGKHSKKKYIVLARDIVGDGYDVYGFDDPSGLVGIAEKLIGSNGHKKKQRR